MLKAQSAKLDRKKLFGDPVLITTIVILVILLTLFILYPLSMLLIDSIWGDNGLTLSVFGRVLEMGTFRTAFANTLRLGFIVGIGSTVLGLLFAYVDVYVDIRSRFVRKLFNVVSMLPVVSPPFVLSLSMILLFGRGGLITRSLLHIYDSDIYGLHGIAIVQILTFFPVCYMMLKGLLKNIDPSLEEASRDMGASRWKVFTTVTLPLMLPGLGNAFLVTFIESVADFANPMMIGGSYDTLATTIYLQVTGAYDKAGASAMAVVLLCLTLVLFLIQKYYLEKRTYATLTGKASRERMLIADKSVTRPLSILCGLFSAFVVLMYISIPFGALFKLWGRDYSLTLKHFQYMFKYSGLKAFRDSFVLSLIASPITALFSMIISYLVVKKKFHSKGLSSSSVCWPWPCPARCWAWATSVALPTACSRRASCRACMAPARFWSSCSSCAVCRWAPAAVFRHCGRSTNPLRKAPTIWARAAARSSPPSPCPSSRTASSAVW